MTKFDTNRNIVIYFRAHLGWVASLRRTSNLFKLKLHIDFEEVFTCQSMGWRNNTFRPKKCSSFELWNIQSGTPLNLRAFVHFPYCNANTVNYIARKHIEAGSRAVGWSSVPDLILFEWSCSACCDLWNAHMHRHTAAEIKSDLPL